MEQKIKSRERIVEVRCCQSCHRSFGSYVDGVKEEGCGAFNPRRPFKVDNSHYCEECEKLHPPAKQTNGI